MRVLHGRSSWQDAMSSTPVVTRLEVGTPSGVNVKNNCNCNMEQPWQTIIYNDGNVFHLGDSKCWQHVFTLGPQMHQTIPQASAWSSKSSLMAWTE